MNTDIIDEIERYLTKYRSTTDNLKLKYLNEPEAEILSTNTSFSFNKTWCKLGLPEKLNRLMRYLSKVQLKLNLNTDQTEALRKFFYENVNSSLSSDDCVSYDPVEAEIITIMGLKCEGNNFYIRNTETTPKPEGIRVKQRVFADISHLISSSSSVQHVSPSPPVVPETILGAGAAGACPIAGAEPITPVKKQVIIAKKK
jgi:hypothetical protein